MLDSAWARERNRLLALLPTAGMETILPHLSVVPLVAGVRLEEEVYFVLSGLVSLVLTSEGKALHIGLVGRDGAVGLTGLENRLLSLQTVVLAPGSAAKISRSHL